MGRRRCPAGQGVRIGGVSGIRTRIFPRARRALSRLSYHPNRVFGAWGWFRANLSALSTRRCHQISFPGQNVNWCGRGESNSFRRGGAPPLNQSTTSASVEPLPKGEGNLVRPRGFEPLVGRPACFTDAGFTDRWQERDANSKRRIRERCEWRKVKESNLRPEGRPGFQDRLRAATRHPPGIRYQISAIRLSRSDA